MAAGAFVFVAVAGAALAPVFLVAVAAVALPLIGDFFVTLALELAAGFAASGVAFVRVDLRLPAMVSWSEVASVLVFLMYLTPAMGGCD